MQDPFRYEHKTLFKVTYNDIRIHLLKHDMTTIKVHAIVNAANEGLDHSGGLALAVANAAGKEMEDECNNHKKLVKAGTCFTSGPGNMARNIQHIIHAVGPDYRIPTQKSRAGTLLRTVFTNILTAADDLNAEMIAVPLLSTSNIL